MSKKNEARKAIDEARKRGEKQRRIRAAAAREAAKEKSK